VPTQVAIQRRANTLSAVVTVPGSKSITNRALVCAALAKAPSKLFNVAPGDDTKSMIAGLNAMGASCIASDSNVEVELPINRTWGEDVVVDALLAGTTARFLTAVAALRTGCTTVVGEPALRRRPMAGLLAALQSLGAHVTTLEEPDHLPVKVCGGYQTGHELTISGDVSSQFITALLLIAPSLVNGMTLRISEPIVSEPYVAMTCSIMQDFGASVDRIGNGLIQVRSQGYNGRHLLIEPDATSASYPLAAAAIVGGTVTIPGIGVSSLQGDVKFSEIMSAMGCAVVRNDAGLSVSRDPAKPLSGITINMASISDLVPTVAVVAMFASTPTRITGVNFVRGKESDRLGDLATELRVLGGDVDVTDDGLIVRPSSVHGGVVDTHHDHRLAMALSLVGLARDEVVVRDPDVVSKSWPQFWQMLDTL